MEPCEACDFSSTIRSLVTSVPHAHRQNSENAFARRDSKHLRDAFGSSSSSPSRSSGLADLPLDYADLTLHNEDSQIETLPTAAMYGYGAYRQPNCVAAGIRNGVRGAVIGSAFGGAMALSTAVQSGYRGTAAASYAGMGAVRNAAAFGSWTALYGFSRCGMVNMRRRNDLLNPMVAGAFTGGVLTLASVRGYWRYNRQAILVNAAGSAMIAVMFEALSYM